MSKNADKNTLIDLYITSFRGNWDRLIFSDYEGPDFTYSEAAQLISRLHLFFAECNIKSGDRIALFGRNSSRLGISFIAIVGYGAVAVPILPDFNPSDVHHIINHSESKILFAADQLFKTLDETQMTQLEYVISLTDFSLLVGAKDTAQKAWNRTLKKGVLHYLRAEDFSLKELENESLCVISYTSGTSGFTKGVMIPARSLQSNIDFARDKMPLKGGDKIVSFLPMAHVFGLLFEFLFPVTLGCHITFLSKTPSPQIIINAFKEIQPHLILSVPLVIEKIYKKRILPSLEKPLMKLLFNIPGH